ncbi:MAG TPA: hypothetical protein DCE44_17465, partial [Verrucomicrobiales bacterium]|nr:hypothetical protein [Verrucomicrobiales bacterium]
MFAASRGRADRFSWEESVSGNFTDPNRWHGPNFPEHTRFPGAADDASIDRGPLTVTIAGNQATRELVTGQPTLNITGSYTVESIFGLGSPLTIVGGGTLNVTQWQLGSQSIVDGATAKISSLQPLGSSPPSEVIVRNGAEVTSQTLDKSRGSLRVLIEGAGATWKHSAELPFAEIIVRANGRVEVSSTDGVFVDADGGSALLTAFGRFKGYGRIANGARIQCAEGVHSGQNTTIDGGTWASQGSFINEGSDITIQNGGVLSANNLMPGSFSALTLVDGIGSRLSVANLFKPLGGTQLKHGGVLTCAEAQLDLGFVYAETGGAFTATGEIFCNNGLNLFNGGLLQANGILLADAAGGGAGMNVVGSGSFAQISTGLAVGQRGQATLNVRDQGRVISQSGGLG